MLESSAVLRTGRLDGHYADEANTSNKDPFVTVKMRCNVKVRILKSMLDQPGLQAAMELEINCKACLDAPEPDND